MCDEHDERTEHKAADHIRDRVGGGDHETYWNQREPEGRRRSRSMPDVGDNRHDHERADGVPTRVRVVERHDVKPNAPIRPVERWTREEVLADHLDAAPREPCAEPHERRPPLPATHEGGACDRDDRARGQDRGGIGVEVEHLVPPRSVQRKRPPQRVERDDAVVRNPRIERRHHVVEPPLVETGQRPAEHETGQNSEGSDHRDDPTEKDRRRHPGQPIESVSPAPHNGTTVRRVLLSALCALVLGVPAGAAAAPILGVTGNTDRFLGQTTQDSIVDEAFLGWGQGQTYATPT